MFSSALVGLSLLSAPYTAGDVPPPAPPADPPAPAVAPAPPPVVVVPDTGHPPHPVEYVWPRLCSPYNVVNHAGYARPELPKPKEKTLYERLGGEAGVKAVIDDFVAAASADPKVNFTRKGTAAEWKATPENVARLKKNLVDLVGSVTGGPQKYTGKGMAEVHRGMKITRAEFDAAKEDLKAVLDKKKVPAADRDELLKIVEGTAADVIDKPRN